MELQRVGLDYVTNTLTLIYTHTHVNLFIYVVGYKVIFLGFLNYELSLVLKNRGTGSRTHLVTGQRKWMCLFLRWEKASRGQHVRSAVSLRAS